MNIIEQYVGQMFKTVPLTKETIQLKTDILANMEDKYYALIEDGASEHEAIGVVIAEFGNIEELLDEMGIKREDINSSENHYPVIEREELAHYLETKTKSGLNIGLGILASLAGVSGQLMIMSWAGFATPSIYIGILFLLAFVVIGVALFITEGMKLRELNYFHSPFVLMPDDKEWLENLKQDYKRSYTFSIVAGVSVCILSLTPLFISLLLPSTLSILTAVGMMLLLIGFGVVFFVYSGNYWNAFTVLLTNGKSVESIEAEVKHKKKTDKVNYIIDEIYWPVILVIYFVLSFGLGNWNWSWTWLVFVIGGVLESTIKAFFMDFD